MRITINMFAFMGMGALLSDLGADVMSASFWVGVFLMIVVQVNSSIDY